MSGPSLPPSNNDVEGPSSASGKSSATSGAALTTHPLVPDYDLLRRIGGGSYGEVWLARSQATSALRAAKIVWRHTFENERPFKREFEGIQRFEKISREHPSQLALFHIGRNEAGGYFYYVMELADDASVTVDGRKLTGQEAELQSQKCKKRSEAADVGCYAAHTLRADLDQGRLPAARVLEVGLALSEALSHLHSNGLVHRDVKPSNVIFINGRPKLADIGLVTDASDQCSIVGTEGYLPPEGPGTPRADIFALGKVLYEAATGLDRRTFPDLPPEIRSWPDAAQIFELNEIILKACESDPRRRYASAEEFRKDLACLGAGESIKKQRLWQARLRVVRRAGLAVAVVILTTLGTVFLWQTIIQHSAPVILTANEDGAAGTFHVKAANAHKRGLRFLNSGTVEGFVPAAEQFNEAIAADPDYIAANARLFETYLLSEDHGIPYIEGKANKLKELADRLGRIAPTNAETHAARAIVLFLNEWKWSEAESEFKQALTLNANCQMALIYYGYMLTRQRRTDEARALLKKAVGLSSDSAVATKFLGHCEFADRHYAEALRLYRSAWQLEPNAPCPFYWLGRVNIALTNYDAALDAWEKHEQARVEWPQQRYNHYRDALTKGGPPAFWKEWDPTHGESGLRSPVTYSRAERFARLGNRQQALDTLQQAVDEHDAGENLLFDEFWDGYRDDPKFKEILHKVGLDRWAR